MAERPIPQPISSEIADRFVERTTAIVSETAGGVVGPRAVGERTPNAFGLFDMHGNVWELTTTDQIRGGSWRDSLPMARSANRKTLDQVTAHPLVGVRFILSL